MAAISHRCGLQLIGVVSSSSVWSPAHRMGIYLAPHPRQSKEEEEVICLLNTKIGYETQNFVKILPVVRWTCRVAQNTTRRPCRFFDLGLRDAAPTGSIFH